MLHEKFSSELFIKRTKEIMNQYLEKCSTDPDIFYDITLSINCLYGLLMMPAKKYYKKLPDDEVHSYLKQKGIDETEISVTSKLINGNKPQLITFKNMIFGIRNGLAHWEEKDKKLDGTHNIEYRKNDAGRVDNIIIKGIIERETTEVTVTFIINDKNPIKKLIDLIT